ncbi:uncharacterized protein N7459_002350 [Penicillium hispanicum]|uniref:uncharacterized protein n=1 Tax=Penicillium hispanicum TaxID=1080232 RepID=UPI0025401871|nr:uncharacterized protein N7459_002350 [Penicillium hispanicum]KAJ5591981.1 hypothetical protein N7459_002350 [Penicillium hispanicum]
MADFLPDNELFPHVVDHYARVKPDAIYAEYPKSPMAYDDGFRCVSFRAFANAINGLAWWLTETLGPGQGETLAYIGPNDVRYPALVLGATKAGYALFLTSPRNSMAAHECLFKTLHCDKLITPMPRSPPATAMLDALSIQAFEIPSVDELLTNVYPHFEYPKTYPENASDIMMILHTSGSTGLPKPIIWTLEAASVYMRMANLVPPDGFETQQSWMRNKKMFLALPPFHAGGIACTLFISIPAGITIVLPTSGGLPTAAALVEARKKTQIDTGFLVPSIINELAQSPELLEYCGQNMDHLMYCGGDLPQAIGDTVASKIKLVNHLGATEQGLLCGIHSIANRDPRKDWKYMHFHPELGTELRPVTDDEYELVHVRSPERETHQFPFAVFPDLQEYPTRDLFTRHPDPSKPDLWRWSARADDVIVFLNGEKTNPVSMEQHIYASTPDITGVLVAGAQRFQASLLVEWGNTALSSSERAAAIETIWPSIEEANQVCPAHARIARTHILFITPDKPMLRAGKGTISRAATIASYTPEIEALYADAERLAAQSENGPVGPGRVDNPQQISDFIQASLESITSWHAEQICTTENFFLLGLDSLQAITATRIFKRGFDLPSFTPNLIYLNPSLSALTRAVLELMRNDQASKEATQQAQLQERQHLLQQLMGQIVGPAAQPLTGTPLSHTVVLTGSTGTLGTYILDALLKIPSVTHVHCLNRRKDSLEIQRQKCNFLHLPTVLDTPRVNFWHADTTQKDLGLAPGTFKLLQDMTTVVIHNAWGVNFNLSLSSFKPELASVVNMIDFTASASRSPHLFFISSISSVLGHRTASGRTPEAVITTETPAPNGYANSKYIAEQLLGQAAPTRAIRASFARVGQVAGTVRTPGLWKKSEWFPSLVLSSLRVGAVPEDLGSALGRIDWVPMDLLAEALVELALAGPVAPGGVVGVYHPHNPHVRTWGDIQPVVAETLSSLSDKTVEMVSLASWVDRVRQDIEVATGNATGETELQLLLEENPAAKLLEFFEEIASASPGPDNILDTQETAKVTKKMQAMDGVKNDWVKKWIVEWLQ